MNTFELPKSGATADWMIFLAMLLAIVIPLVSFVLWLLVFRKSGKKKRRRHKHRHKHRTNPTLAQTGGLPPVRDPDEPLPGP